MGKRKKKNGKVRIGVAGAGKMGGVYIKILNELDGLFDFVGAYDPIPERAEVVKAYGAVPFYSFEKMLNEVDAIVLSSPTSTHKEMALWAAEKGVHVLVEKPIAENRLDAISMYKAFEEKGLKFTVNHVERFNPVVRTISDLAPNLDMVSVEIHRCSPYDSRIFDVDVATDLMIHDIDIVVNSIFNAEPTTVKAIGRYVYGNKLADYAHALLQFQNGGTAFITASRCTEDKIRDISIHAKGAFIQGDMLRRTLTVKRGVTYEDDANPKINYTQTNVTQQIVLQDKNPLKEELTNFGRAILFDEPLLNRRDQVMRTMGVLDRVEYALYGRD